MNEAMKTRLYFSSALLYTISSALIVAENLLPYDSFARGMVLVLLPFTFYPLVVAAAICFVVGAIRARS